MRLTVNDTHQKSQTVELYSREGIKLISDLWMKLCAQYKLMYEITWLGTPIIQVPEDIIMMQELIWNVRPDVIIETGVAHGGSAIFYASILELLGQGVVIGIDIEIRQHNKIAVKNHPLAKRITLIEGSSVDDKTITQVHHSIENYRRIMVVLDSDHTYEHVLQEMRLYSKLVSADSYLIVMDGAQEAMYNIPRGKAEWKENNPLRAIRQFLEENPHWEIDEFYNRLHVTSNPSGFLKQRAL